MQERPNKLRYVRRLRDLTQAQLADQAGLSAETVSDLERGRYRPGLDTALALSRVLEWPAEDLFMPSESGTSPDNSLDGPDSGPASAALPLDGQEPTSTSSGGPGGSQGFLQARSPGDPTADRSLPAKESSAELEGAR